MVQIIAGNKGKGKTKYLLDMANTAVKESKGSIVYLDKSAKHMYELNNKIRLINVQEYPITSSEGFIGFLCGIICQDHDLEDIEATYRTLETISEKYHITFVLSISMDADTLPEIARPNVVVSL